MAYIIPCLSVQLLILIIKFDFKKSILIGRFSIDSSVGADFLGHPVDAVVYWYFKRQITTGLLPASKQWKNNQLDLAFVMYPVGEIRRYNMQIKSVTSFFNTQSCFPADRVGTGHLRTNCRPHSKAELTTQERWNRAMYNPGYIHRLSTEIYLRKIQVIRDILN